MADQPAPVERRIILSEASALDVAREMERIEESLAAIRGCLATIDKTMAASVDPTPRSRAAYKYKH